MVAATGEQFLDGLGSLSNIQSLGIMNALKTGDPRVDMILALCLPFAIRHLLDLFKAVSKNLSLKKWLVWWYGFQEETSYHERIIRHTSYQSMRGHTVSLDEDSQNSILIKAVRLYCHTHIDFNLRKADLSLTTIKDSSFDDDYYYGQSIVQLLSGYKMVKNPPEKQWHSVGQFGSNSTKDSLVELCIDSTTQNTDQEGNDNSKSTKTTTYTLRSRDGAALDTFLSTAYEWYVAELEDNEDVSRYYYDLESKAFEETSNERFYKRFKLSEEKTFDSLFFQEKNIVLKLINDFMSKQGKYAIKGYPHKLGLLLTGPPGTGKTSLIKALAHHTGRSIINVPLSKIETNAELMSQFFDRKYRVRGEMTVRLDFKDVIFCLEDLDAASDIVKRRDGKTKDDEDAVVMMDDIMEQVPPPKSLWRLFLESSNDNCRNLVKLLMEKSERLKAEAERSDQLQGLADSLAELRPGLALAEASDTRLRKLGEDTIETATSNMSSSQKVDNLLGNHASKIKQLLDSGAEIDDAFENTLLSNDSVLVPGFHNNLTFHSPRSTDDSLTETTAADSYLAPPTAALAAAVGNVCIPSCDSGSDGGGETKKNKSSYLSWMRPVDSLNLTGILNALDGVVDCPGRIVIMTTNHPEKLDKALIRPGRIDKQLHLGYMAAQDVVEMLEHYFETELEGNLRQRIQHVFSSGGASGINMTPAQIEQMTAEHDKIEAMIEALEAKALASQKVLFVGGDKAASNSSSDLAVLCKHQ